MKISENELLCGVRAPDLREALKWLEGRTFVAAAIGDQIGLDAEAGERLFRELLAEGYIRRHSGTGIVFYVSTDKGDELANATLEEDE